MKYILSSLEKKNQGIFDIIIVTDRKNISLESFENWYQSQKRHQKVTKKTSGLQNDLEKADDFERTAILSSDYTSFTAREAAGFYMNFCLEERSCDYD